MSLDLLFSKLKGSSSSGNFGHGGRPGKRGGSMIGGGHSAIGIKPTDNLKSKLQQYRSFTAKPARTISDKDIIKKMQTEKIKKIEGTLEGASDTYVGQLKDGTKVIVKDAKTGNYDTTIAEKTTYEVAKQLGVSDLVTPVAIRKDGSSVQKVQEGKTLSKMEKGKVDINENDFKRTVILDVVSGNIDRNPGNVLVGAKGKVYAIDNDYGYTKSVGFGSNSPKRIIAGSQKLYKDYTGRDLKFTASDFSKAIQVMEGNQFKNTVLSNSGSSAYGRSQDRLGNLRKYVSNL